MVCACEILLMSLVTPVSYTHLDVYKRQHLDRMSDSIHLVYDVDDDDDEFVSFPLICTNFSFFDEYLKIYFLQLNCLFSRRCTVTFLETHNS